MHLKDTDRIVAHTSPIRLLFALLVFETNMRYWIWSCVDLMVHLEEIVSFAAYTTSSHLSQIDTVVEIDIDACHGDETG